MKVFSFRKPVSFKDERLVVANLAYNHKYKEENQYLVIEGKEKTSLWTHKAFYDKKGKFLFVKLFRHNHRNLLVCRKQEYDTNTVQKVDNLNNRLIVTRTYLTTCRTNHKLVEVVFYSSISDESYQKVFKLDGNKWCYEGEFPKEHFMYWLESK